MPSTSALMASLKLSDEDNIQLLINGISNIAIRAAAATLSTNSLDEFLKKYATHHSNLQ